MSICVHPSIKSIFQVKFLTLNNAVICVLYCVDKPWPPGRPTVTSMTRDSVTLSWSPPRNDGGSPVTGYIVESKSSSYYAWTSCSAGVRVGEPHFVVPNLVDGTSYEFRVIAENRAGRSEPSPPSTAVVVRDIAGEYRQQQYIKGFDVCLTRNLAVADKADRTAHYHLDNKTLPYS